MFTSTAFNEGREEEEKRCFRNVIFTVTPD